MKTKALQNVLERVEAWPPDAQDALAEMALELKAEMTGTYNASTSASLAKRPSRAARKLRSMPTSSSGGAWFPKHRPK